MTRTACASLPIPSTFRLKPHRKSCRRANLFAHESRGETNFAFYIKWQSNATSRPSNALGNGYFGAAESLLAIINDVFALLVIQPRSVRRSRKVCDWVVTNPAGKQIGTDEVSKAYGDCVIIERWHDADDPGGGIG